MTNDYLAIKVTKMPLQKADLYAKAQTEVAKPVHTFNRRRVVTKRSLVGICKWQLR